MVKTTRGRPQIAIRLAPEVLLSLRETAELYGVSVAELARAMVNIGVRVGRAESTDWQKRVEEIREELGGFKGQLALPIAAGKPAKASKSRPKRGKDPHLRERP
jgi:hypothetical protein